MKSQTKLESINRSTSHHNLTTTSGLKIDKYMVRGIWRLCDPKISMASISSMFLGTCAALAQGSIEWRWLLLTVIGILFLEAAKNASGEIFDYDSGTDTSIAEEDRSPFSGGKRVIVDRLMTRTQTITTATILYGIGIVAGLTIVLLHEPKVMIIGIIGVTLAYFYNAPPVKLSYRGFGETAVALVYGPLICCGTYLVLRHNISMDVIILSIPLGLLIAAFLIINEFPDRHADKNAGKKNLVVLLGDARASWLFLAMIIVPYSIILLLPMAELPQTSWIAMTSLPFGLAAAKRLFTSKKTTEIIPAQCWTLLSFALTSAGLGIGILL